MNCEMRCDSQTTNAPEVQGKVLSWNNLCSQISLISSPLVLSAIYTMNHDAIYYFSMIFSCISFCIMLYISTWPNAKTLGKQGKEEKKEKADIEMAAVETKEVEANDSISPVKTETVSVVTEQSVKAEKEQQDASNEGSNVAVQPVDQSKGQL